MWESEFRTSPKSSGLALLANAHSDRSRALWQEDCAPQTALAKPIKLHVLTRKRAAYWYPDLGRYAVISITTPGDPEATLIPTVRRVDVLRLAFHDVGRLVSPDSGYIAFDDAHARAIWQFVDSVRAEIDVLVVHCDHGQSRSPAVCAAIDQVLLGGDGLAWFNRYPCNELVYDLMIASRDGFIHGDGI